jgi:hypothetical protein
MLHIIIWPDNPFNVKSVLKLLCCNVCTEGIIHSLTIKTKKNKSKNEGKTVILEGEESGVKPLVGSGPPYWGEGPNLTFLKSRRTHYFYKNTLEVPKYETFLLGFFNLSG